MHPTYLLLRKMGPTRKHWQRASLGILAVGAGVSLVLWQRHAGAMRTRDDALIAAILRGNDAAVERLLTRGARADARDADGNTALILAIDSANTRAFQVDQARRPQAISGGRRRIAPVQPPAIVPLIAHPPSPRDARIIALISQRADVNARGPYGGTALMKAAVFGQEEVVGELLRRGADPNLQSHRGNTALMSASAGHVSVMNLLLTHGADVDRRSKTGETALHALAGTMGNPEAARLLIEHGADVNALDAEGRSVLLLSAERCSSNPRNHVPLIEVLVRSGAEVNGSNSLGLTPLMLTLSQPRLTRLLLAHGAETEVRNNLGNTALHLAAIRGYGEAARLLLESDADTRARNGNRQTPLDLARESGKEDLVRLLSRGEPEVTRRESELRGSRG